VLILVIVANNHGSVSVKGRKGLGPSGVNRGFRALGMLGTRYPGNERP